MTAYVVEMVAKAMNQFRLRLEWINMVHGNSAERERLGAAMFLDDGDCNAGLAARDPWYEDNDPRA